MAGMPALLSKNTLAIHQKSKYRYTWEAQGIILHLISSSDSIIIDLNILLHNMH